MSVDRLERVNSLLKRVIAEGIFSVMQGDSVAPGLFTVTDVRCGKDLRDATVMVSVFGDDGVKERGIQHLQHNSRKFQQLINREVRMKFVPKLVFKLDRSLERGDAVLELLNKLEKENGESDPTQDA
ncbi:MAG: 30S ribosome-binding factor RbfA [Kiritimatiellae bacterium]|nr:30S ribosome-binding factor RbfA [Kiritimatiellia bacterium]